MVQKSGDHQLTISDYNSLFTRVFYQTVVGLGWSAILQIPSCRARERHIQHPPWWWRYGEPRVATLNMARVLMGTTVTHPQPVECLSRWWFFRTYPRWGYVFPFLEGKLHSGSTQIFWVSLVGLFTLQVVYLSKVSLECSLFRRPGWEEIAMSNLNVI